MYSTSRTLWTFHTVSTHLFILNELQHTKNLQNKIWVKGVSDQPLHPHSLISLRWKWAPKLLHADSKDWSDWVDVQADLSTVGSCFLKVCLHWVRCTFVTQKIYSVLFDCFQFPKYESPQDKTNKMTVRPAKTDSDQPGHPLSLIRVFACLQWVAEDPSFLHADSEESDQTGWMPRLIWVFAGRTCHFVGFVMKQLKCNFSHCWFRVYEVSLICAYVTHIFPMKISLFLHLWYTLD